MRPINKDILKLAIPSILANITVPLVGMVDIAVAGHLDANAATLIGGIAIGTMLFDLLYWNFGFLRVGTGGLTAQAFGKGHRGECAKIFARSLGIALACALLLILIQWIFVKAAFLVIDCTPEVRELASRYFFIRIWAAPATLSLMAFKGWFIGMQDSVSPMAVDRDLHPKARRRSLQSMRRYIRLSKRQCFIFHFALRRTRTARRI